MRASKAAICLRESSGSLQPCGSVVSPHTIGFLAALPSRLERQLPALDVCISPGAGAVLRFLVPVF
jgi:hypothetical protein